MDSSILKKAGELLSRKSKYRHWQAAVAVLSVAVIGTTAVVLSQPAQTLTKVAYCGMEEHEHGEECYERVLICGYEGDIEDKESMASSDESEEASWSSEEEQESEKEAHEHDDSCYAERLILDCSRSDAVLHEIGCYAGTEALICGQEHTHEAECYGVEAIMALACGQEEGAWHTHDDDCYIVVGAKKLTCGQEEGAWHTHTDDCYEVLDETDFLCREVDETAGTDETAATDEASTADAADDTAATIHTHTDECYTIEEKQNLTCGLEEKEAHTHNADCYTVKETEELTCGEEESEDHQHTDDCYEKKEEKVLSCELEETPGHTHTEECYETVEEKVLTCEMEEQQEPEKSEEPKKTEKPVTAAHVHTVDCCRTESILACGKEEYIPGESEEDSSASDEEAVETEESSAEEVHVHTDECYEVRLTCGKEEHEHTDGCYREAYCGIEAHVHMPGCYDEDDNVICGMDEHIHEENCYKEPHCGITAHTHTDECYDKDGNVVCGREEHYHTDECFVEKSDYSGPFHCQEKIHRHSADCYDEENNLICGLADYVVHAHSDSCYDEEGELICPLPEIEEHAHSAQCYDIPGEGEEAQLVCGKEEAKLHTHTEECYDEKGKLTCGMLQVEEHVHSEACLTATEEAHVHTESCYDEAGNLICGYEEAHTHTEECYDEEGKLICGYEEEEGGEGGAVLPLYCDKYVHSHDKDCYDESGNLICGKADFAAHVHTQECYNTEEELVCPLPEIEAHTHGPECYGEANEQLEAELVCEKEELKLHEHTEDCYGEDGELTCGKQEILEHVHSDDCHVEPEAKEIREITYYCLEMVHEHTDECYDENGALVCGKADYVVHNHAEECYGADEELICPLPEIGHIHTEACFPEGATEPACGQEETPLHSHTESCYDENGALICGQLEVVAHIHSAECEVSHKPVTQTYEGGNFIVTATYKPDANLPEDAKLRVEQITAASDEEHYAKRQAEYQEALGDDKATMQALLKIGFYVNGEEVEPESPVTITVQFLNEDGLAEGKPITVIHFADEGTELLEGSKVEDGSTTFEMNSFSEIAVGYGVENVKVPVNEELKYETDEFQVTFKIEGEVRVPVGDTKSQESEGAEGEAAVPGDSTEGEATQGEENDVDNPEAEVQTGEGGVSVSIENSNLEKKLEFRVDPVNENAEEYAKAVAAVYADGTVKTEDETTIGDGTQQEDETNVADGILTEDGSQPEEGTDAGEDIEAAEPEIDMGGDQLFLQVLAYGILYDGQKLDLSDCTVTAEVRPSEALVEYAETALDPMTLELEGEEQAANDIEVKPEVVITAVELAKDAAEYEIADAMVVGYETMAVPMLLTLRSEDGAVAIAGTSQANPTFTVEFYAEIDVLADPPADNEETIRVIDTSKKNEKGELLSDGSGGNLPTNEGAKNKTMARRNVEVNADGTVATTTKLTEIYSSGLYNYVTSPGLVYFDKIAENKNYKLKEIWVQRSNSESWETYSCENGREWHFTNKLATQTENPDKFILITDNAKIRLVHTAEVKTEEDGVMFYDYDVSDGNLYLSKEAGKDPQGKPQTLGLTKVTRSEEITTHNSGATWYMYTNKQGINSMQGQTFGFGNSEGTMRTTLGNLAGNRANDDHIAYGKATFGLVTGLKNGKIQYAPGVIAPNLFDDGTATGKTPYAGNLIFSQKGDTFTLTGAEVKVNDEVVSEVKGLDKFKRQMWSWASGPSSPTYHQYYFAGNDFYPLDDVATAGTPGHDLKFGAQDVTVLKNFGGYNITGRGWAESAPKSDDGENHNHYFGMKFTVEFDLVEDYVGPLEYLFYGDDDMWVFLDGGGYSGKLICDIGGVHTSVGEYINLWDYIKKETEGHYKLTFYYTERGASGSTCWMQFTLPSVTFATTQQDTGELRIEKKVNGSSDERTDEEFGFEIQFKDSNGTDLMDDYSYTKFDKNNNVIENDILIWNNARFTLKAGQHIVVKFLPNNSKYTITEVGPVTVESKEPGAGIEWKEKDENPYTPEISGGSSGEVGIVTGNITKDSTVEIEYNNIEQFTLPETGGSGTTPYTVAGTTIVLLGGAGLMYRKKFRERRG